MSGDNWEGESDDRPAALCSEVRLAYGLVAWLCHDCRKEYFRETKNHPLSEKYGEASLRLEFWKARIGPGTSADGIEEGLKLWKIVEGIEREINAVACKWLVGDVDDLRQ
jgi:hypothetical protein